MTTDKPTPQQDLYTAQLDQINRDGEKLAFLLFSLTILTLFVQLGILLITGGNTFLVATLALNGGLLAALYLRRIDLVINCQNYLVNHTRVESEFVYALAEELGVPKSSVDEIIYIMPMFKNARRVLELHHNPEPLKSESGPAMTDYQELLKDLNAQAAKLVNLTFMLIAMLMVLTGLAMRSFGTQTMGVLLLAAFLFTMVALYLNRTVFYVRARAFLASKQELEQPFLVTRLASELSVTPSFVQSIISDPPTMLNAMVVVQQHSKQNEPKPTE